PWFRAAPARWSGSLAKELLGATLLRVSTGPIWKEKNHMRRLEGKRVIVTDPTEYNGADIVALFREEGAEVFAESWDMTKPEMADKVVQEVGRVDILIANLAYPHTYAPAHQKTGCAGWRRRRRID